VLGFTALVAVAASLIFGLVPALQAAKVDLRNSLQKGAHGSSRMRRDRLRGWLVARQVALAMILLTVAGLIGRSFLKVQSVQTGFRADSVLAFDLQLSGVRYGAEPQQVAFFDQLLARLQQIPGVRATGAISYLPLGGGENMGGIEFEGEAPPAPGQGHGAERRWVTPGYFAAMGIPLHRGRVFQVTDNAAQPRVVVINQTLAKAFPGDPIGQRLKVGGAWRTVIGIVSDVKSGSLEAEIRPQTYIPNAQWSWSGMTLVLQTEGNPFAYVQAVRNEVKALDSTLPLAKIRTLKQVVSSASSGRRFNTAVLVSFALAALLLTLIGIYGIVAFLVGCRRREIGTRMALGAQRGDVLRLVLQQGMKPVCIGSIAGLAGSLVTARLIAAQLYGVLFRDTITLTGTLALVLAAALLACWLPARRAANAEPMRALRTE